MKVSWWRGNQGGAHNAGLWFTPHVRIGRLRFNVRLMKHTYGAGPDRWVIQTSCYFDRKSKSTYNKPKNGE